MRQGFSVLQLVLPLVLLSSFLFESAEAQRRRARFRQQTPSAALECRVFCSEEKLRTPVAELIWRSSEARLSATRIEVTVYKDGFQKGSYVALDTKAGQSTYQPSKSRQGQQLIPALSKLVVVEARSLRDRTGMVVVRIEGLEPGLNYFWRVVAQDSGRQIAAGTARCEAPVCPADMQPDEIP